MVLASATHTSCLATKSCPSVCKPVDCSPPGPSVRGILQARMLEWVATSFSREGNARRSLISLVSVPGLWLPKPTHPQSLSHPQSLPHSYSLSSLSPSFLSILPSQLDSSSQVWLSCLIIITSAEFFLVISDTPNARIPNPTWPPWPIWSVTNHPNPSMTF